MKKKTITTIISFIILVFLTISVTTVSLYAQAFDEYHLNITNGMPTNNTYCLLIDKNGYLWISTNKGVIKYNGYQTKLFDMSNGLPNNDIWRIYEDRKKRIWTFTISRNLGYLYEDKFRPIINLSSNILYPKRVMEYQDGIYFLSPYATINEKGAALYIEKDDTLYSKSLSGYFGSTFVDNNSNLFELSNDTLSVFKFKLQSGQILLNRTSKSLVSGPLEIKGREIYACENNILFFSRNNNLFYVIDTRTNISRPWNFREISSAGENFNYFYDDTIYNGERTLIMISDKKVYLLDGNLAVKHIFPINTLLNENLSGDKVSFVIRDSFWNNVIATRTDGVFMNFNNVDYFKKIELKGLQDFRYVGSENNGTSCWWNTTTKTLAQVQKSAIQYHTYRSINYLQNIVAYNNDTSLLLSNYSSYWLNNKTGQITDLFRDSTIDLNIYDAIISHQNGIYAVSKMTGVTNIKFSGRKPQVNTLVYGRYIGLVYDSITKVFFAYNNDEILVYKNQQKQLLLTVDILKKAGITNIEKIVVDNKYGNIIIKEYNQLLIFNTKNYSCRALFSDINLTNALVSLKDNKLIIAGEFGVLFSSMSGPGIVSKPIIYPNIKGVKYNYVTDIQVSSTGILLKTDKGFYEVKIPDASSGSRNNTYQQYTFVLDYNNVALKAKNGDTLIVDQNNTNLQFDVVKPTGVGVVKYYYHFDGDAAWKALDLNELTIPQLTAGKYYILDVVAEDDVWRSDVIKIYLYFKPYWWQRTEWKAILIFFTVLLLAIFGIAIFIIARRLEKKSHEKKSRQLEIELKSIYSQISPHFIFNTLNSILSFIHLKKTDEAYTNVTKFSRLLRTYIESSRKRFVSINEEVKTLSDYIELQQGRFADKFDYEIIIGKQINRDIAVIPAFLLQPLVENAINHGLFHKEGKGKLTITFSSRRDNEIICTIEDDGIGREQARHLKEKSSLKTKSQGGRLVEDLIKVFNEYENVHIEIQYIDKQKPFAGTIVELCIKHTRGVLI